MDGYNIIFYFPYIVTVPTGVADLRIHCYQAAAPPQCISLRMRSGNTWGARCERCTLISCQAAALHAVGRVALLLERFRSAAPGPGPRMAPPTSAALKCEPVFDLISGRIDTEGASLVKKVKGSFLFKISGSDGGVTEWLVDLKTGAGAVTKSPGKKGDCTISMKDSDFIDLVSGKLGPQKAFFEGKLKMSGNMALAMKLQSIVPRPGQAKL